MYWVFRIFRQTRNKKKYQIFHIVKCSTIELCCLKLWMEIRLIIFFIDLLGTAWWFFLWVGLIFYVEWMRLKTDEWLILTTSQMIRFIPSAFTPRSVTVASINYHSAHNIHIQLENGHQCQYYVSKWNIFNPISLWPLRYGLKLLRCGIERNTYIKLFFILCYIISLLCRFHRPLIAKPSDCITSVDSFVKILVYIIIGESVRKNIKLYHIIVGFVFVLNMTWFLYLFNILVFKSYE